MDRDGARYQDHGSIDLSKRDENIKAANLEYSQRAFFLPGDYRLAVAMLDTATGEHSSRQTQFRVAPRQRDLLNSLARRNRTVGICPTLTVGCGLVTSHVSVSSGDRGGSHCTARLKRQ
jgi:hypothetical protein